MSEPAIEVTFRIPGQWSNPSELVEAMPSDCRWEPERLTMPDGHAVEINFREPDDQFVSVFATMCRREPTAEEKTIIEGYTVQVCLTGDAGSFESMSAMMRTAAAMIHAGGGGVFIDNSGVSFGGTQWCSLTDDGSRDAMSFACVGIIRGKQQAHTTGMHLFGLPDVLMRPCDLGDDGMVIIEMIQYLCEGDRTVADGHVIADLEGPRFRVSLVNEDSVSDGSPMFNPYGRLKLVSVKDIAELN